MSSRNDDESLETQFKDVDSYRSKELELLLMDEKRSNNNREEKIEVWRD